MKELAFEYYQFCIKFKHLLSVESAKLFKIELTEEQITELLKESHIILISILQSGGVIYDKSIFSFHNITDYLEHIRTQMEMRKSNESKNWIQDRPARQFFVERKPKNKQDILLFDKMEECIEIINEYWDKGYFTPKELSKQLICITERNYGGENRIGIMVKKEPYANQYSITVRGITGGYNVALEGNGEWTLELERGAKRFTLSKSYRSLPTKDELIDDFISLDILEKEKPVDFIHTDTRTFPIYPTAKEYFK